MGILDKTFHDLLQDSVSLKNVVAHLITRRLAADGIRLDQEQLDTLNYRLASLSEDDEVLTIEIADLIPEEYDQQKIVLDFHDPEEIDKILNELSDRVTSAIPNMVAAASQTLFKYLKAHAPSMLQQHRQERKQFEQRLSQTWGKALNLLEMSISIALETGAEFNKEYRPKAIDEHNFVFEALTRLHARACQVAQEVLVLLQAGFADGAHARWRTLHEITVVAWFIKEKGNEAANQYLLHQHIESYIAALQHQKYHSRLSERPVSIQKLAQLKVTHDQLVDQFGSAYKKNYGWASTSLGHPDPKFDDIEQAIAFDHWRPYYKLASHNVHANPKGALYRLGLSPNRSHVLLAGASDAGLAEPGQGTMISLSQITTALLTLDVNVDRMVTCQVMQKLVQEGRNAFITVHRRLKQPRYSFGRRRIRRWKQRK